MGFLDKLKDSVNAILNVDDATVKRYYGVILVMLSNVKCLTKENIKSYFKKKYNEICDEAALDKALSKFDSEVEPKHKETWYKLSFKQSENEKVAVSSPSEDEIYDICFADYKEDVKEQFYNIITDVKAKGNISLLGSELEKMERRLSLPQSTYYPLVRITGKAFGEVMIERIRAKDDVAIWVVTEEVCEFAKEKKGLDIAYALAIRANNFRENIIHIEAYPVITEEMCRDAVMKSRTYAKKIEEDPSREDVIVRKATNQIYTMEILPSKSDLDWRRWAQKDPRFADAACYYALEKMATHFTNSDTSSVESSVNLVASYMTNN